MATSLESQLIEGEYRANVKDPKGEIARAQEYQSQQIIGAIGDVAGSVKAKKDEEKAEQEKLEKEQEAKDKANSDAWDKNEKEWFDNQGLGTTAWEQATGLVKGLKTKYNACEDADDPSVCRRKVTMELKSMSQLYTDQKTALDGAMDTKAKIKSGDLDLSGQQTQRQKDILAGLNDSNSAHRMKNDEEITKLQEQLKNADPINKKELKKQIEQLKKSNVREVGYDIPGVGFVKPDELADLQPHVAHELGGKDGFMGRVDELKIKSEKLKAGADGGEEFNMDESIGAHKKAITKNNVTSLYFDPVLGGEETLKDQLMLHPVFSDKGEKRIKYSDLGLDDSLDTDKDGFIDADEKGLSKRNKQKIINALADPNYEDGKHYNFETSKAVAAEWMALKEEKEANRSLYGKEYYQKPDATTGKYTYNGVQYDDITAMQTEIKRDKTTLRNGGRENEGEFLLRGGIKGMMQSGTVLVQREEGMVTQKLAAPGDTSIYNE